MTMTNASTTFQTAVTVNVDKSVGDNGLSWFALGLGLVLAVTGIAGNALVCLAVRVQRKLQNVTNYFLVSLAATDLLVSLVVIPCCVVQEFVGHWTLGFIICDVWQVIDVMLCTSSIWHMCTISIDRYIGIRNPLRVGTGYRFIIVFILVLYYVKCIIIGGHSQRVVGVKIAAIYVLSFAIASPLIFIGILRPDQILVPLDDEFTDGTQSRPPSKSALRVVHYRCAVANHHFLVYGSIVAFFVPLAIMLAAVTLSVRLLAGSNGRRSRWFASAKSHASSLISTSTMMTLTTPDDVPIDNERSIGGRANLQQPEQIDEKPILTTSGTRTSEVVKQLTFRESVGDDEDDVGNVVDDVSEDDDDVGDDEDDVGNVVDDVSEDDDDVGDDEDDVGNVDASRGAVDDSTTRSTERHGDPDLIVVPNYESNDDSLKQLVCRDDEHVERNNDGLSINNDGDVRFSESTHHAVAVRSDEAALTQNRTLQAGKCGDPPFECSASRRWQHSPLKEADEAKNGRGFRSNSYVTACTEFHPNSSLTSFPSKTLESAASTRSSEDIGTRQKSMGDHLLDSKAMTEHDRTVDIAVQVIDERSGTVGWKNSISSCRIPCNGRRLEGWKELSTTGSYIESSSKIKGKELHPLINDFFEARSTTSHIQDQQILDCTHLSSVVVAKSNDEHPTSVDILMSSILPRRQMDDDCCPVSATTDCASDHWQIIRCRSNDRPEPTSFTYSSLSATVTPSPTVVQTPRRRSPKLKSVAHDCFRFPRFGQRSNGEDNRRLNGYDTHSTDDDAEQLSGRNFVGSSSASCRFRALIRGHESSTRAAALMAADTTASSNEGGRATTASTKHTRSKLDLNGGCTSSPSDRSERKAARVLGTVFVVFVVCWTPFFVVNLAVGTGFGRASGSETETSPAAISLSGSSYVATPRDSDDSAAKRDNGSDNGGGSDRLLTICQWLGYASSTLNPIIYTAFNRTFRRTFVDLVARCRCTAAAYRAKDQRSATAAAVGCARRLITATARLDVEQEVSATVMTSHETRS